MKLAIQIEVEHGSDLVGQQRLAIIHQDDEYHVTRERQDGSITMKTEVSMSAVRVHVDDLMDAIEAIPDAPTDQWKR